MKPPFHGRPAARLRASLHRIAGLFGKRRRDRELDEEIASHLQLHIDDNVRAGMSPEEARRQAILCFGPLEAVKESYRDRRGIPGVEAVLRDLRWSLGMLRREPAFALVAILTLAVGIGANATAFGVVDGLLFRPPAGVGDPDDLYRVRVSPLPEAHELHGPRLAWASFPEYEDLRDYGEALAELAAYRLRAVIYGEGAEAREIMAMAGSANYFTTLRVEPALGTFWTPGGDHADEAVVVLGHDFWQRELGGDPEVVGRTIELSSVVLTIIGVAPAYFRGIDLEVVDLFVPINAVSGATSSEGLAARNAFWLWMVGRPSAGLTAEAAAARTTDDFISLAREYPEREYYPGQVRLVPVTDRFFGQEGGSPVPAWLLAVTAVVLLVACANCSNLLLARGAGRRRELAVRAALGASRARRVQLLLIESLLLAFLGGAAGVLLSLLCSRLLYLFDLPPLDPVIDTRVLIFAFAVAALTSLLVGLWPALRLSRADVGYELEAATPGATHDRSQVRAALTVLQVALSIVLLVNAALFVRSLRNVRALDGDFDFDNLLVVTARFEGGTSEQRVQAAKEEARDRLRDLPGVRSTSIASTAPYGAALYMARLDPQAWRLPPEPPSFAADLRVDADYFTTLDLPLLAGRGFTSADRAAGAQVMIVNAEMAAQMGGGGEVIGRCIPAREGCTTIIGIVANTRFSQPLEEPVAAVYRPLPRQAHPNIAAWAVLLVRTTAGTGAGNAIPGDTASGAVDRASLAVSIRRELMRLEPAIRFVEVETVADLLAPELQPWRIASTIFTLFGGLAFLLAVVGLYGVIAYLVAARRPEISIRKALGASRARIRLLVLGEGALLVAVGVVAGLACALGVSRLLEHRMYAVAPTDPLTYGGVALLVSAAALAAGLMSAERASRVDPNLALRNE